MAVSPGIYNISLQRRADYYVTLQFKDYTDRAAGTVSISLTDTQTEALPDEVYYDVMLTDTSDIKEYYLEGVIYVSEGYTA